jgi:hypothetical protein
MKNWHSLNSSSMKNRQYLGFLLCFLTQSIWAQSLKVVDANTLEPIPFFHLYDPQKSKVLMGGPEGTVSLDELISTYADSLYISHVGYETMSLRKEDLDLNSPEILIKLQPLVFELEEARAQILDEEQLFIRFQTKLKNQLSKNSWLVRVHSWEFIDGSKQVIDQYGLLGFGGLMERKGKLSEYDGSNYFLVSEYARKTAVLEYVAFFDTKDIFGVVLNELLQGIAQAKPKKVSVLSSSREKLTFAVSYRIEELKIEFMISEAAELLEIKWTGPLDLNLSFTDNIRTESGKIRFYADSELLVPISVNLKFERISTKKQHQFYMLSSFIPSPLDYRVFLSENYPLGDYYKLMAQLGDLDDYDSKATFFQSSKARFESKKMTQFAGKSFDESISWIDITAKAQYATRRMVDDSMKAKVQEFYEYKIALLGEYKKLGLTW